MTFLQSSLLAGLAPLIALPIIIHFLNKKLPLQILFPNIDRILKSLAGRSRLVKWRHLILLLIRTAIVAMLLLAFLWPVLPRFGSDTAAKTDTGHRRVLLIADRSMSMEHKGGTQTSAAKRLLIESSKIIATLEAGDSVNVIVAARQAEALLPEFTTSHDQVQTSLAALTPSMQRADMTKALGLASTLLGENAAGAEIYILSDFQRAGWADVTFESLPKGVRIFFVDAASGERERPNTAILRVSPSASVVSAKEPVKLEITMGNFTPDAVTLPLEAIVDGRLATPGEIKLAPWSTGRTTMELAVPTEGLHGIEVRSPDDALPADNHRWVRLDVREREEVLVLSDDTSEDSGARFVLAALDPWDGKSGPFTVKNLKSTEVTPQQLGSASRVVLTGVGSLKNELIQRLATFMEQGGGVLWFLDGTKDAENLEAFNQAAGGAFAPFQLAGRLTSENFGGAPQKVAKGNFDSRFLRLFRGAGRQSLGLLEFYAMQRALPTANGSILLSFADGMPALGSAETGLGTAIFCNFAPAELSSNLARQRLFPAWMQDMVKALKSDAAPEASEETGGAITAELWMRDLETSPIVAPDNSAIVPRTAMDNERVTATFPVPLPGMYAQGKPGHLLWTAAVNVPAEEADLRGIDPAEIQRRSEVGSGREGDFVSSAEDYSEIKSGRPVYHWFVLAAAALIAFEMLLFRPFLRAAGHPQS